MSEPLPDPYELLVALTERELASAREGEWEQAADVAAERARQAARLPEVPPAGARDALERLAVLQRELMERASGARDETRRELGRLARGRGAVRGYGAGPAAARPAWEG